MLQVLLAAVVQADAAAQQQLQQQLAAVQTAQQAGVQEVPASLAARRPSQRSKLSECLGKSRQCSTSHAFSLAAAAAAAMSGVAALVADKERYQQDVLCAEQLMVRCVCMCVWEGGLYLCGC